jgi:hypothetical protein
MPLKALILCALGLLAPALAPAGVCTPTAATLCVGVDDYADVWINGQCVATCLGTDFAYVDGSSGSPVPCISVDPSILSATGSNYVAVRVRNTSPTEMWGTWALDITCSNGGHSYVTSSDPFQFYDDPSGTNPPPVIGGLAWTDPAYSPLVAWGAPTQVTGSVFGKRAIDPQTGLALPPMSWDAGGDGPNGTEIMYFRQGFQLTPVPTPLPPAITVQLAPSACFVTQSSPYYFYLTACNSGGNSLSPTSATFTLDGKLQFQGPWSNPPGATVSDSGQVVTVGWPALAGGTCNTVTITAYDYYIPGTDDGYITHNPYSYTGPNGASGGGGADVPLALCVYLSPTPSPVPSPSPSVSPTFSVSPTPPVPSATPSISLTATPSPSCTVTPTASPCATVTLTRTAPPTPTASLTATPAPPHLTLTPYSANPDPASRTVWLPYLLSTAATVDIKVYDIAGELVKALDPVAQAAGVQEQAWDLNNTAKAAVSSGVYLCRIHAVDAQGEAASAWVKAAVAR